MYFLLLTLSTTFSLIPADHGEICSTTCLPPPDLLRILCKENISTPVDNSDNDIEIARREKFTHGDDMNILNRQEPGMYEIKKTKELSSRLPLNRQQILNLEKHALYDYYLNALRNNLNKP